MEEERKRLPRQQRGKLTKYKRDLIREYLVDYDGTKSILRVGYDGKNPTQRAWYLLHLPEVEDEIERQEEMILKAEGVNKKSVLTKLARIANVDIAEIYNDDGTMKLPRQIDERTRTAIAGIEVLEEWAGKGEERIKIGETKKIRLRDSIEALKTLAKHLKLTGEEREGGTKVQVQILIKGRDVPLNSSPEIEVKQIKTEQLGD